MHGRIKTISSEEQKEKQRKSRELKIKLFQGAMGRIVEKRNDGELDDEMMRITQDVLLSNPNIITLWNIRRETMLGKKAEYDEELWQNYLIAELTLTEQCLKCDPKSYGTWHHRLYILENMPPSVWQNELKLCDKMLSLDERNFHCWDYRKLVVDRANVSPADVYTFTTTKIESNFSNYSAWHFRSKVLPMLFADPKGAYPLEESKHREELELVQNAAFTDPDDQSAWFYQRWLLNLHRPPLKFLWVRWSSPQEIYVSFTRNIRRDDVLGINVSSGGISMKGNWRSLAEGDVSTVWRFLFDEEKVPDSEVIRVTMSSPTEDEISVQFGGETTRPNTLVARHSEGVRKTLEEQLSNCNELLELEPDSKWTLLTATLLMRAIDPFRHNANIKENLQKLAIIDRFRKGYYEDLQSQISIEHALSSNEKSFSQRNLHCLHHTQHLSLMTSVNLSGNHLKNSDLKKLYTLIQCAELILDCNEFTSFELLPRLPQLRIISVKENPIVNQKKEEEYLKSFPCVESVAFSDSGIQ